MSEAPGGLATKAAPLTSYQKRLFAFLGVATFFEGYDFFALTQLLTDISLEFELSRTQAGLLLGVINAGTVLAYLLVGKADRWGRRRVLSLTILGYALFTFMSGLAPNVWVFGVCQLLARVFLIGEWATSMVVAAEEFPDERRGYVIGVITAASSLGGVVCAGLVPVLVSAFGWRSVYFAGVLPLLLMAWARRDLKETALFAGQSAVEARRPLGAILQTPYRRRVLSLGAIWFLTYVCTQNGVTLWKDYAIREVGHGASTAAMIVTVGALVSMPLCFLSGRLFDRIGRRPGAVLVYAAVVIGVLGIYGMKDRLPLTLAMIVAMVGLTTVLIVLNAFTTELFPTNLRGDAFMWSNNLIGRIGYWLSPPIVGFLAENVGWGPVVRATVVFPVIALFLVLALLPETRGKKLEAAAGLPTARTDP
jgi:MFS transporter, putative metabolite:H+ symporter